MKTIRMVVCAAILSAPLTVARAQWKPAEGPLTTPWAKEVSPDNVHPEYPRPQMVRKDWINLNGLWEYAIRPAEAAQPWAFDGQILVPFAAESALSGVMKPVGEANRLWYRRFFTVPRSMARNRILLHFGAVDWHTIVYVNGKLVGEHKGGYDPFTFDITDALRESGQQELVVSVWDPTNGGTQPRGKQLTEPQGIWYTPVTGIWQTVWLEPVPAVSIDRVKITPDIDTAALRVTVNARGDGAGHVVRLTATDGGRKVAETIGFAGQLLHLNIDNAKLWAPGSPHLYDLKVTLLSGGEPVDEVASYFGMRKIALGKDEHGYNRLFLNNEPLFQFGPLDQGWWPDGLYTAPTDAAMLYDIEITQQLGFNMIRKHVKVEPARWYYHCDRLGMLVWQDMPSGMDNHRGPQHIAPDAKEDAVMPPGHAEQFEAEWKAIIDAFYSHPSIVMWVPFNEGWGQYDTHRIAAWTMQYDPSRLVNATSGWTDRGVGHVYDVHMYPGPGIEDPGPNRAVVLGEFGGLGWPVEGHLWWDKRNWGYRTYQSREELNRNYHEVVGNVYGLLGLGLSAAVYTQTTDVEGEVNGLMTYDRKVLKFDPAELRKLAARLYGPPPTARVLVPSSERQPQQWSYSLDVPRGNQWMSSTTAPRGFKSGDAPFQSGDIAMFNTGTKWGGPNQPQIALHRAFTLDHTPSTLWLKVFQNVAEGGVYINGVQVTDFAGSRETRRHYQHLDISQHLSALRQGENVLSVQVKKERGPRGIDIGLYTIDPPRGSKGTAAR